MVLASSALDMSKDPGQILITSGGFVENRGG
jgi:hypothetical protein